MMSVITGGSGSGKSAFAESRILTFPQKKRIYIATMYPFGEEGRKRIERHRKLRAGKGFDTVECYTNLDRLEIPRESAVLLECMSNLTANEMFQEEGAGSDTPSAVKRGILHLKQSCENLVVVTNEIFSDACPYEKETVTYQSYLGEINRFLAETADEVVEVVYGIPVYHKVVQQEEME